MAVAAGFHFGDAGGGGSALVHKAFSVAVQIASKMRVKSIASSSAKCRHKPSQKATHGEDKTGGEAGSLALRWRALLDRLREDGELVPRPPKARNEEERRVVELASAHIAEAFAVSHEDLASIESALCDAVAKGLAEETHADSSVKSLVTYVHHLPDGREEGRFLAIDLGGTNLRIMLVELTAGSTAVKTKSKKHQVSEDLMTSHGSFLFDFIAECLHLFLEEHDLLRQEEYHLGLTFSFPTRQRGLDRAELISWTKGFSCADVEGREVVALLEEAIARRNCPQLRITVAAILNDTTGCLLSCAFKKTDCLLGVILGTGTNAAYVERLDLAQKYEGQAPTTADSVVINTEWGAFGERGEMDAYRNAYDIALDAASLNPGKQIFEKLIGGMYLGELVKLVLIDAIEKGIVLKDFDVEQLRKKDAFLTRQISDVEKSNDSVQRVLDELGVTCATDLDCDIIRYICECVSMRASKLAAAGVACLVNRINKPRVTVAVDGTVYRSHPHFARRMNAIVRRLVCDCTKKIDFAVADDGSGRGAAMAAAVAARTRGQTVLATA